jgi:hypothetical protein
MSSYHFVRLCETFSIVSLVFCTAPVTIHWNPLSPYEPKQNIVEVFHLPPSRRIANIDDDLFQLTVPFYHLFTLIGEIRV